MDSHPLYPGWTKQDAEKYEKITGEWPLSPRNAIHNCILHGDKPPRPNNDQPAFACRELDDNGDFYDPYDPDGFGKDD